MKNSADYVRYLLDGSGVEDRVNFAALRKELDSGHPSLSSNVLDSVHWKTSLPSGPGDVSFDIAQSRRQVRRLFSFNIINLRFIFIFPNKMFIFRTSMIINNVHRNSA